MTGLLERDAVMAAVGGLLDRAGGGRSGTVFLVGEAGIGKTSVLDASRQLAGVRGFSAGVGRGEAMETALPFGLMAQVVTDLGGAEFDGLDPASDGPEGRAARFYAVWRWLGQAAARPVLLAFDDLHWADADSLALLSFLCRRLAGLPVAVIATLRPWPQPAHLAASGLAHDGYASVERLDPLSRAGAAALLATRSGRGLGEADIDRAAEISAGNPLLLEQVALEYARGEQIARPGFWRDHHEQLLLTRFAGLPASGLACARAAAVLGTRFRADMAVILADLDDRDGDAALDALDRSGLVRPGRAGGTEFVHPLFRQALYDDLGDSLRARLHARAFSLLAGRGLNEEACEHAVKADLVGDPAAISVLARAGRAARAKGAIATAGTLLESAVSLAGDGASAGQLCDLAEALSAGGRPADAIGVCERVLALPGVASMTRARTVRALAQALVYTGAFEAGTRRIAECVDLIEAIDPAFAVETLLSYSAVSWLVVGPAAALGVNRRAADIAKACDASLYSIAEASWAVNALETGDPGGLAACEAEARRAEADAAEGSRFAAARGAVVATYATAAKFTDRLADSAHFYGVRLRIAERYGLVEEEAAALAGCIDTLLRQLRLDAAAELIDRCDKLSDLVPLASPFAAVGRANMELFKGRLDESEESARQADVIVTAIGAWCPGLFISYGRAWRLLAEGRLAEACALYEQIEATSARVGLREPCEVPWAVHAVAAYVRSGRLADAGRVIGWLDDCGRNLPCRWLRLAAASGRALVAEAEGDCALANKFFQQAMAVHGEVDLPLERIQTLLEYGRFLRRSGQPQRARVPLAHAVELGEQTGARWLAGQARQELRVAGGRRRRAQADPRRLTAQEERVAALAATGASNAEIAGMLYLSVSTIETHLEHVYAKLAIRSRRQLAAALADRTGPR